MADGAGLTDGVKVELNPEPDPGVPGPNHVDLPERPSDSAKRDKWAAYLVALGADEHFINNETEHVQEDGTVLTSPALSRAELVELADKLGG